MYQQNTQLPYSPDRITGQFLHITMGNPPFVPQYRGDPQVEYLIPTIAAGAALEIQQNAQNNPLRTFMFNQFSENNFANSNFNDLVVLIADAITMNMRNSHYANPEALMQQAIPHLVQLFCAYNIKMFPGLTQYVNQGDLNGFYQGIQELEQLFSNINRMKNGGMQQPMGGYNQNMGYQPRASHMVGRQMQNLGGGNTGIFTQGGGLSRTDNVNRASTRFNNDARPVNQPFTARKPVQQEQPSIEITNNVPETVTEVLVTGNNVAWKPNKTQPYFPAYNPYKVEMFYKMDEDGNIIEAVLRERTKALMDYERHSLKTVFGLPPSELSFTDVEKVRDKLQASIAGINKAITVDTSGAADQVIHFTSYIKEGVVAETCLNSAWMNLELSRLSSMVDGVVPFIYRIYARVAEPTISMNEDESDYVEMFAGIETYIELRDKLKACVDNMSGALWNLANRKMTKLINRIIKQEMSIPGLSIESFVEDIQDLIDLIAEEYGNSGREAFLNNQTNIIKNVFKLMDPVVQVTFNEYFFDSHVFPENVQPKITYTSSDYSLTYLDCSAFELEIELAPNVGAAIIRSLTPMVYDLVSGLFKDDADLGIDFTHHLIRTNDGHTLECVRGALNKDFFILTLLD